MISIENEDIEVLLSKPKTTAYNTHWVADCPVCGKSQHFFVRKKTKLVDKRGRNKSFSYSCKKCKEEGGFIGLLRIFNKLDLFDLKKPVKDFIDISFQEQSLSQDSLELKEILNPVGFKRLYDDEYLNKRGFQDIDYYKYEVGRTKLIKKYKDYIIILVYQQNRLVGYMSRCTLTKQQIEEQGKQRYLNSKFTNFGSFLFGIDEVIKGKTKHVNIVEGFFDKNSVDHALSLNETYSEKCVCSFGNKISTDQISLLKQKGVQSVTLAYDIDATKEMKKYMDSLRREFHVDVTFTQNKDFNESTTDEIIRCFDNKSKVEGSHFVDNYVALPKF